MTYTTAEARQELLDAIAQASDDIAAALAALGAAYELLDDASADRLEGELFGPVQKALGRAKRVHAGFAERSGLPAATYVAPGPGAASRGVKALLDDVVEAIFRADVKLSTLQDSMRPVEVGDAELRAGLVEVRTLVGGTRERARGFVRTFGR